MQLWLCSCVKCFYFIFMRIWHEHLNRWCLCKVILYNYLYHRYTAQFLQLCPLHPSIVICMLRLIPLGFTMACKRESWEMEIEGFHMIFRKNRAANGMISEVIVALWCHMASWVFVNIGSGNGLLPDGTKPLPDQCWLIMNMDPWNSP